MGVVYLMIRRKQLTLFMNVEEDILVEELKDMIGDILNLQPDVQRLYFKNNIMQDYNTLLACNVRSVAGMAINPATIGLALMMDNGEFESLRYDAYQSTPQSPSGVLTRRQHLEYEESLEDLNLNV